MEDGNLMLKITGSACIPTQQHTSLGYKFWTERATVPLMHTYQLCYAIISQNQFKKPTTKLYNFNWATLRLRFKVLVTMTVKNTALWDMSPCSLVDIHWWFGGTLVYFYHITWCHIPQDGILHMTNYYRWNNIKTSVSQLVLQIS
jgi:hypothetical protein